MKYLSFAALILVPGVVLSQAPATLASTARAPRVHEALPVSSSASAMSASVSKAKVTPVLDGKLDDPAWQNAQSINSFLEYDPNQGADSRFKTDVRIVHDDKYLYVMARMYDPAPDSIISLLSRRDMRTQSEQLKLVIDSYHDRQTAYQFAVNPSGVKRDFYVSNDSLRGVEE